MIRWLQFRGVRVAVIDNVFVVDLPGTGKGDAPLKERSGPRREGKARRAAKPRAVPAPPKPCSAGADDFAGPAAAAQALGSARRRGRTRTRGAVNEVLQGGIEDRDQL